MGEALSRDLGSRSVRIAHGKGAKGDSKIWHRTLGDGACSRGAHLTLKMARWWEMEDSQGSRCAFR